MGRKLKKVSNTTGTTDYVDGIQYTDGNIDFIQTGEGIARKNGDSYSYEYNLSDLPMAIGIVNVRTSFDIYGNAVRILQRDDYYAFGMRKSGLNGNGAVSLNNKYLYNGKELQDELEQYDYGARFYDPVVGRWNVVDPLVELYQESTSPYIYVLNNPILLTDPDGRYPDGPGDDFWKGIKQGFTGYFGGIKQAVLNPVETVKSQFTHEALKDNFLNTATMGAYGAVKGGLEMSSAISNGDFETVGKAVGEKAAEGVVVLATEGAGRALSGVTKGATKGVVSLDNNALIAGIEGGEKAAVKAAIGGAKPMVSITAAKEFLVKGDKGALRGFMKEMGASIGSNGSASGVQGMASGLGRKVGAADASIIGGAIKSGATVITRDTKMIKFMEAAGVPFKTF